MNTVQKFSCAFFSALFAMVALPSCSSDDEPMVETQEPQELAEWIKSCVLDDDGQIGFLKSETEDGLYAIPAGSAENAAWFVEELTRTKWEGTDKTLNLDGYGTIRIAGSETEGIYNRLTFDIKDVPSFTLEVATPEYFEQNNSFSYFLTDGLLKFYVCRRCHYTCSRTQAEGETCPHCGFNLEKSLEEAQPGDLYCVTRLFGKLGYTVPYEEANSDERNNCLGVVIHIGHQPTDLSDYSNTGIGQTKCHGYVLAKDFNDKYDFRHTPWGPADNGLNLMPDYPWEEGEGFLGHMMRDWNGFYYTSKVIEAAGGNIAEYIPVYVVTRESAPTNSSGWFLPSLGQLKAAYQMPEEMLTRVGGKDSVFRTHSAYYSSNVEDGRPYVFIDKVYSLMCIEEDPAYPRLPVLKIRGMLAF